MFQKDMKLRTSKNHQTAEQAPKILMFIHKSTSKILMIHVNPPPKWVMLNHLRSHVVSSPLNGNTSSALGKSLSGNMASWRKRHFRKPSLVGIGNIYILYIYIYIYLFIYLFVYLFIYMYIYINMYMLICIIIYIYVYITESIYNFLQNRLNPTLMICSGKI